jgi:hypothetical protein
MTKLKVSTNLWDGHPLPIIGISGSANAGKSYLAATLCAEKTLYLDTEKGAGAYKSFGCTYKDIRALTRARINRAPTPKDLFETVLEETGKVKLGDFELIVIDPFTGTLEQGIVELVSSKYASYGFTSESKFTSSGGLFWSRVRGYEENFLLDLSDRCTSVVFVAQMKTIWRDGSATKEKEPQGKSTLFNLAALYLVLERKSITRHVPPPLIPSAQVLKSHTLHPFPPRLPEATYETIYSYLTNGLDGGILSEEEQIIETPLSDDEKLQLQATIEETKLEAATAELERAKIDERLNAARTEALQKISQGANA